MPEATRMPIVMSGTSPPPIRNVRIVTPLVAQPGHMFGRIVKRQNNTPHGFQNRTKPDTAVSPCLNKLLTGVDAYDSRQELLSAPASPRGRRMRPKGGVAKGAKSLSVIQSAKAVSASERRMQGAYDGLSAGHGACTGSYWRGRHAAASRVGA